MSVFRFILRLDALVVLAVAIGVMSVPLVLRVAEKSYSYEALSSVPQSSVALVLGASVVKGAPSRVLADRADVAAELYREGKVRAILVSGDDSSPYHNEVTPTAKYLQDAGIPPSAIFLDHAGLDTYSSFYRARAVFHATSLVIVTQDFHLPRSLFIAHALGMSAVGIAADNTGVLFFNYAREIPASIKAVWDVATHRVPKYLGDVISLEGDGRATW